MVNTLIFDMDGLLVDSEPWWKVAEKEVFGAKGLQLNDELLRQVMGFRLNEVVAHWYHYQPWPNPNFEDTENQIIECMVGLLNQHATALVGVKESLEFARTKGYKIGLASSSAMRLIEVVVDKLDIREYFHLLLSAETVEYGKPHPAIFIKAASLLESHERNCLVLEDSINGVIAAKAARMLCVAVPEPEKFSDPRFGIADFKLKDLTLFPEILRTLESN